MATRIKPLNVRVLVKRLEQQAEMKNGLFIPDVAQEKPQQGVVIGVGKGQYVNGTLVAPDVNAGDLILFGKYSGNEVPMGDDVYLILKEEEILAKIVDDGTPEDVAQEEVDVQPAPVDSCETGAYNGSPSYKD